MIIHRIKKQGIVMRKFNAVLSVTLLTVFLVHIISGIFNLCGFISGGSIFLTALTHTMELLAAIHLVIGVKLTANSVIAVKKSGVSYFKENKIFWIRRISGAAVIFFIVCHVIIFTEKNDTAFRLNYFGAVQLVSQILMVLSVAVHVLTNIKPLMLSLGISRYKSFITDILAVLSVILLLSGVGFTVYYFRWTFI